MFIAVSILAHVVLLALIAFLKPTVQPLKLVEPNEALKSYLVVKTPPTITTPKPIVETQENNIEIPKTETNTNNKDTIPASAPPVTIDTIEDATVPAAESVEAPAEKEQAPEMPIIDSPIEVPQTESPTSLMIPKQKLSESATRYQNNLHQMKVQEMAEQAARDYRKAQTSPEINPAPQMSIEEKAAALRKIEVDCASATKQGIAIVTGLFGGTVECRKHSNFQQYIDKHLSKTALEDESN